MKVWFHWLCVDTLASLQEDMYLAIECEDMKWLEALRQESALVYMLMQ